MRTRIYHTSFNSTGEYLSLPDRHQICVNVSLFLYSVFLLLVHVFVFLSDYVFLISFFPLSFVCITVSDLRRCHLSILCIYHNISTTFVHTRIAITMSLLSDSVTVHSSDLVRVLQ